MIPLPPWRGVLATPITLCLLLLVSSGPAGAQPAKPEAPLKGEATRLKSAGDVLMDQDRYSDALVLYDRAYALSGDPALLYNEGRAYEALGEYPKALEKLETFEQSAPPATRARVPGLHELIVDLRGRLSTLVVKTNVPHARILVRGKDEGVVFGERSIPLRAGVASVEVASDGYEAFRRDLELSAGATLVLEANLVPWRRDARVVIRASPSTARLVFDGKDVGRAPVEVKATPGSHELVATADGYYEERVPMTVALGDRRDMDLELRKIPGIASRWWLWTGIGAVVVGGIATAVILTREKPHSRGTFPEGSIAAP